MAKDVGIYPLEDLRPNVPVINISPAPETRVSYAAERQYDEDSVKDGLSRERQLDIDSKFQEDPFVSLPEESKHASSLGLYQLPHLRRGSHGSSLQDAAERRASILEGNAHLSESGANSTADLRYQEERKKKPTWRREDVDSGYGWVIVASEYDQLQNWSTSTPPTNHILSSFSRLISQAHS